MKRFEKVFVLLLPAVLLLTSCNHIYGFLQNKEEVEASNTKFSLEVTITTEEEEETITPSMDENSPTEVTISEEKADLIFTAKGSKIAAITQEGYFYEEGFLTRQEVNLGFTKLPEYTYEYTIHIPLNESFPVEVELNNGKTYYLILTRE